ncbi:hypothetical protein Tsubulata_049779 [Turnera subulata]|uniref:Uncharacterized protein n=1 Tax=Turnera subulata TaxID=218843 RepID=A0A9Q0F5L8_9ROSI|nr:hypothetical protein Tsubulata_049779 [Turnera subulata]
MAAPEVCRKRKQSFRDSWIVDDDDGKFSGTAEDGRYAYRRAIDGVVNDGMVPLDDDVLPDSNTMYVPLRVKKVYDLYIESLIRSGGFDCDGYYYWKLPEHLREGRAHPIEVSDPNHASRLETCAQYAITVYNKQKKTKLRLEEIEKANVCFYNDFYYLMYYITMKVKDHSTVPAELKTCRARVVHTDFPGTPIAMRAGVYDPEPYDPNPENRTAG